MRFSLIWVTYSDTDSILIPGVNGVTTEPILMDYQPALHGAPQRQGD